MKNDIKISLPSLKDAKIRRNIGIETIKYKLDTRYENIGNGKKYYIYTYGCQGNLADSEKMAGI